jgi:hypothetical protein
MLILDTDHLTVIQRQSEPDYTILRDRLRRTPEIVCTTIVNIEEQLRGWLSSAVPGRWSRISWLIGSSMPCLLFSGISRWSILTLRRLHVSFNCGVLESALAPWTSKSLLSD